MTVIMVLGHFPKCSTSVHSYVARLGAGTTALQMKLVSSTAGSDSDIRSVNSCIVMPVPCCCLSQACTGRRFWPLSLSSNSGPSGRPSRNSPPIFLPPFPLGTLQHTTFFYFHSFMMYLKLANFCSLVYCLSSFISLM